MTATAIKPRLTDAHARDLLSQVAALLARFDSEGDVASPRQYEAAMFLMDCKVRDGVIQALGQLSDEE